MGLQQLVTFVLVVDCLLAPAIILENELAILSFDLLIWVVFIASNTSSYEKALALIELLFVRYLILGH